MLKKTIALCLCLGAFIDLQAQTISEYINKHLPTAQRLMREHQVPASIVLGVAIHESAAGKSKIARKLNNHFGVKGKNSSKEIRSAYRDYETDEASFEHFATFLKAKPSYSKLFDTYSAYDYKNWARGIQRGGYASSKTWASQVINLIQKYELYQYDDRPEGFEELLTAPEPVASVKTPTKKLSGSTYIVKKGDNLSSIAKRKGTTAKALMLKNKLKSSALKPGQKIKI